MASDPRFSVDHISSLLADVTIPSATLVNHFAALEAAANTPPAPDSPELFSLYYSAYIISLLLDDDVNEARFLSKRIASNLPSTTTDADFSEYPLIPPTYKLLQAVYTRSYSSIYTILLTTLWTPPIQPLVLRFLEHFRRKTFGLLSYAYTTITPSKAATYLGFQDDDEQLVVEKLTIEGWIWDEDQGLFRTVNRGEDEDDIRGGTSLSNVKGGGGGAPGKDGRIKRLTGLVTHLTDY
ncbi:COP9 signalosome [Peziza echinospora]|nr:COP9 signalosome [Peziza echinospora]